jgi:hypothetical protein
METRHEAMREHTSLNDIIPGTFSPGYLLYFFLFISDKIQTYITLLQEALLQGIAHVEVYHTDVLTLASTWPLLFNSL